MWLRGDLSKKTHKESPSLNAKPHGSPHSKKTCPSDNPIMSIVEDFHGIKPNKINLSKNSINKLEKMAEHEIFKWYQFSDRFHDDYKVFQKDIEKNRGRKAAEARFNKWLRSRTFRISKLNAKLRTALPTKFITENIEFVPWKELRYFVMVKRFRVAIFRKGAIEKIDNHISEKIFLRFLGIMKINYPRYN